MFRLIPSEEAFPLARVLVMVFGEIQLSVVSMSGGLTPVGSRYSRY